MLKRILTALAGAVLIIAGLTAPSTAAAADIPGLRIGTIGYNAYGADTATNRNSEYVDVVNDGTDITVAGLMLQDAWARGNNASRCNTFTLKAGVLPVDSGAAADVLPAGRTLRIYLGSGTPRVVTRGGVTYHAVYANSSTRCGYNGHIFNNGASSNRYAPWDTAWITLNGVSESRGYNFSFGYVAR